MIKRTIIFGAVYLVLNLLTVFILISWNSFGGSNSTNLFQKAITFFFTFPGSIELFKEFNAFILIMLNTIFWSFIFYILLFLWQKMSYLIMD